MKIPNRKATKIIDGARGGGGEKLSADVCKGKIFLSIFSKKSQASASLLLHL